MRIEATDLLWHAKFGTVALVVTTATEHDNLSSVIHMDPITRKFESIHELTEYIEFLSKVREKLNAMIVHQCQACTLVGELNNASDD